MIMKYRRLRESAITVFDRRSIAHILHLRYSSTTPVLNRLVARGILIRLKRNCYTLADYLPDRSRKIANELVRPSYISLWTALNDAGYSTQFPRMIQSVTPKRATTIETDASMAFSYARLPESLFFGWMPDEEGVIRAKPEKALLDLLYVQKQGIDTDAVDWNQFNARELIRMAQEYPVRVQRFIVRFIDNES